MIKTGEKNIDLRLWSRREKEEEVEEDVAFRDVGKPLSHEGVNRRIVGNRCETT